jgi:hypothetical protein
VDVNVRREQKLQKCNHRTQNTDHKCNEDNREETGVMVGINTGVKQL